MEIRTIFEDYGVTIADEAHPKGRDGWTQFDCPFCEDSADKFHMGYNEKGGYTNCWKCGFHPVVATFELLLDLTLPQALRLAKSLDVDIRSPRQQDKKVGGLKIPRGMSHELLPVHHAYLIKRGFDPEEIAEIWKIGAIAQAGRLSWRIWIPILDNKDRVVSWTTRSISDEETLRYVTARPEEEAVDHRLLLYGEQYCLNGVIVHEGPLDVWKTGPGATAVLGLNPSQAQVRRIASYPVRVICFDSTDDAQRRADLLCDQLSVLPGDTLKVMLTTGEDAGDAEDAELEELRQLIL